MYLKLANYYLGYVYWAEIEYKYKVYVYVCVNAAKAII